MSALTQTVNQRLAAAIVARGGQASELTMTTTQLLAMLHNLVSDNPDVSALGVGFFDLLEATRNALSDDPDLSSETARWDALLDEILELSASGDGGGGGEGEARQLLVNSEPFFVDGESFLIGD